MTKDTNKPAARKRTNGPNRTHCMVPLPLEAIDKFIKTDPLGAVIDREKLIAAVERKMVSAAQSQVPDSVAVAGLVKAAWG